MITFKKILIRNFMSIGKKVQEVSLDNSPLSVVLGQNNDASSEQGSSSRNGVGKAQPLTAKIKTPTGWTTMGEITVGDEVSTPHGFNARVLGVYPQGQVETYKITFEDGRFTECCVDHLWNVSVGTSARSIVNTRDMVKLLDDSNDVYIPLLTSDSSVDVELPNDPWTMGNSSGTVCIPTEYKNSAINQRECFIRGLMDCNGDVSEDGELSYNTTIKQLALDLVDMVRSIGGIASINETGMSYNVKIGYHSPRNLSRLVTISENFQTRSLKVENIEKIESKESRCIMIDSNDHLYITDDYIVTHNTTIVQAIHFVLFGKSIENQVKISNLINKTNKKMCEVTLHFTVDGTDYILERKRKPDTLHFYIIGKDGINDEAQGENKDTQEVINDILNLTPQLFCHIITLTSYVRPFLEVSAGKQREIMEELLGVTQLSDKSNRLKELNKEIKNGVTQEEFKIQTLKSSNVKIEESIANLEIKENDHSMYISAQIVQETETVKAYADIDFSEEWKNHQSIKEITTQESRKNALQDEVKSLLKEESEFSANKASRIAELSDTNTQYGSFDFEEELKCHGLIEEYDIIASEMSTYNQSKSRVDRDISRISTELVTIMDKKEKSETKIDTLEPESCPTCGSDINHETHSSIIREYEAIRDSYAIKELELASDLTIAMDKLDGLGDSPVLPVKPKTEFDDIAQVYETMRYVEGIDVQIATITSEINPNVGRISNIKSEIEGMVILPRPEVHFESDQIGVVNESKLKSSMVNIEKLEGDVNPYSDQIETLKNTLNPVQYDELNRLKTMFDHQTFLLKLLTSKDSFVRKRIVDQNINFLNSRLESYLSKTGLQHKVKFQNDLTVDITHMGLNYDFGNLSRGEKTRTILALSLAFRDTFEALHQSVNFMMIDELLDFGLDTSGVLQCFSMINEFAKTRNKNVFLVSHREEILEKQVNILLVEKDNGFTTISQDL